MGERIAIVGSRDWPFPEMVIEFVRTLEPGTTVVSGGAKGVDIVAEKEAIRCGLTVDIYEADWNRYGDSAGAIRNQRIINNSDCLKAFMLNKSKGTSMTIKFARKADIKVDVTEFSGEQMELFI